MTYTLAGMSHHAIQPRRNIHPVQGHRSCLLWSQHRLLACSSQYDLHVSQNVSLCRVNIQTEYTPYSQSLLLPILGTISLASLHKSGWTAHLQAFAFKQQG